MNRMALKPFTFSNGVQVPTGTSMSSHAYGTHLDERFYPNAGVFDGFRFAQSSHDQKEDLDQVELGDDQKPSLKSQQKMYATSSTYLSFGHGKHAWCVAHVTQRERRTEHSPLVLVASLHLWR